MSRRGGFFKLCSTGNLVQHFAQIVAQFADFLITIARLLLQRLIQNLLQARGCRAGARLGQGLGLVVDHSVPDVDG